MFKYTQTFKQQVADFYFKNHESVRLTSNTLNVPKRTLRYWIVVFQHSDINSLAVLHTNTKQTYIPDFEYQVIQTIQNREITFDQACLYFGIASGFLPKIVLLFR